jgi:hypothetical protein
MKKAFIGLLIVAAGTAIFFLFQKKNKPIKIQIQKDLIIGKWKLDSLYSLKDSTTTLMTDVIDLVDPHLMKYEYEFTQEGSVGLWLEDSLTKDGARYEWNNGDQLVWKEYPANKIIEVFDVPILNRDSLSLQSKDSVILSFRKRK